MGADQLYERTQRCYDPGRPVVDTVLAGPGTRSSVLRLAQCSIGSTGAFVRPLKFGAHPESSGPCGGDPQCDEPMAALKRPQAVRVEPV